MKKIKINEHIIVQPMVNRMDFLMMDARYLEWIYKFTVNLHLSGLAISMND